MSQNIQMRLNYHPDFRFKKEADRKVQNRLDLITKQYDFSNKTVLDLGCSGGYFSFSLASYAKKVIAVDGDAEVIKRNVKIKKELGITNIEFINANIDSEFLRNIDKVDVTLFLSVYHHMLTRSSAYDWNEKKQMLDNIQLIENIIKKTNTLFFEIGYPNEGYDWCEKLPEYKGNWDQWILDNIFKDYFNKVLVINPVQKINLINRIIISKLSTPYKEDSLLIKRIKHLFKFDARDYRKIFVGVK